MEEEHNPGLESSPDKRGQLPVESLLALSVISAAIYVVLAWAMLYYFRGAGLGEAFTGSHGFSTQFAIGLVAGAVAAAAIYLIIQRPPVSGVLDDFYIVQIIKDTKFSAFDRFQLSLFAGTGEELLFRGAIQPLLGIWWTSALFIGLHGYFKFQKPGHWVFGGMMFGLSMLLGYLFEYVGLIAAMTAHAVYDLIMLQLMTNKD